MTTIVPDRSLEQRMEALVKANEIRFRHAELKRNIKAGYVAVRDIIEHPPIWAKGIKMYDLLLAVPMVGVVKAGKMLERSGISLVKTVGGLSNQQRTELLRRLP